MVVLGLFQVLASTLDIIMDPLGKTLSTGIANPIRLARAVLDHARIPDPLGRVPPM